MIYSDGYNYDSTAIRPRCDYRRSVWAAALRSKQAVREAATICPRPLQVDLRPFDLESDVRVTCDVGYLCANFSLPRRLCFDLGLCPIYATDTSDAHHRLMLPS